ncbi:MAG: CoA-acylating methylmalonate-semialdehyde dehydrogenase [Anaerolineales bacterium]|nr:CoA-acylating methylmalonate-semialdehyde dehydrogenase [Anaerolineales bacterium]MDW8160968.1 CoA-acylating methylmalonate-semialdehyde dehydrogenase [Anaerolineales bacterium]
MVVRVQNYIDGHWKASRAGEYLGVYNPATAEKLGEVPLSPPEEVDEAAQAAQRALKGWRETPAGDRIQYLFRLKYLLEENFEDLSRTITMECGKTIVESRGEMRRAIENVEVASGIPSLIQGKFSEDIAPGIDEYFIRQPVGVVAIICPFNFPGMIPFWFMPYALACGNTVIVKPSEKVPLTMQKIFALMEQCGFPQGVVNLVNGAKETVDAILDHPLIRAISMVGSTPVARYIYARAAANGKRAQCQGGAKNISVVLPDADLETSTKVLADSAFGSAGQRCLATSIVAPVGEIQRDFVEAICEIARNRVVGYGLDEGVEMGPVITPQSKARIEGLIGKALEEDATILVDGRGAVIKGYEKGNFVRPTVILNIPPQGELFRTEIFGPVLSIMPVNTIEEAIELVNMGEYGNMACLFTKSGEAARKFRYHVQAGNVGINIGVAAPMAYFPFSGWKESFFGDLHGQGMDAVEFFTQKKVVIERWPKEWSRKF